MKSLKLIFIFASLSGVCVMFENYCFYLFFTDLLMPKILRAILKTKDYVEANGERLDKIESYMYNSTSRNQNNTVNGY